MGPLYLSPVAEHLPISSVSHQLLWKLEKTWLAEARAWKEP
jgi:hypothetical protein